MADSHEFDPYASNADVDVPVNTPTLVNGPVTIVDYDPLWPSLYSREENRIRNALGDRALMIEHTGSTSVPGLPAKPCIDMLLAVADSADEPAYVPDLEAVGYVLRIRQPEWHEHRVFKGRDINLNLHVWTIGDDEIDRVVGFRDWLRTHVADCELYAATKRTLARKHWRTMQDYANAKTDIIREIQDRMSSTS